MITTQHEQLGIFILGYTPGQLGHDHLRIDACRQRIGGSLHTLVIIARDDGILDAI